MRKLPYTNFNAEQFIVRDWLALDRTVLANERTFLAYGRSALALLLSGLTVLKLFHSVPATLAGWALAALAVIVFIFGVQRFLKMRGHYHGLSMIEESALPAELVKEFGLGPRMAAEAEPARRA